MFPPRLREALSLGGLSVRELALRTWKKVGENEIMTRAAAISFYAMLALVPFLALILTLTVQILPDPSGSPDGSTGIGNMTVGELHSTLRSLFPREAYGVVEQEIKEIRSAPPVGLLSLGLAVTIWLASSLFVAVIDAMNRIYGVTETRPLWKLRLVAIAMTIVEAAILIGALVAIVAGKEIVKGVGFSEPMGVALATVALWAVVVVMVLLSFALTFYVGPDADQRWEWITPGSVVGTLVFLAASLAFRVYVQNFASYNKTYGSLGGVMVLLFWFWISSLVVLTAGQMNQVIEDASPLGKGVGQKKETTEPPDFQALKPEPARADGPR
jgi:membrane protein